MESKKRDLNINLSGFCFADEGNLLEDLWKAIEHETIDVTEYLEK